MTFIFKDKDFLKIISNINYLIKETIIIIFLMIKY